METKMIKRLLAASLFLMLTVFGQSTSRSYYVQRSVTGTLNRITIRQPTSGGRSLHLAGVYFGCSVVCTPKISKNGTLTGGSSGSAVVSTLDERGPTITAGVTLDGTVGSDTTVFSRDIAAAGERSHDGNLHLPYDSTNPRQITLEITSGSSGVLYIWGWVTEP